MPTFCLMKVLSEYWVSFTFGTPFICARLACFQDPYEPNKHLLLCIALGLDYLIFLYATMINYLHIHLLNIFFFMLVFCGLQ